MVSEPVINLCFHGVGQPKRELEPGEGAYWITRDTYLRTLDEVVGRADVVLSFDDGNVTDIEVGLPGLIERDLRATFFALAGRLEQAGSLSAADLRELRNRGMAIGSHGMNHVPWRGLDAETQDEEFRVARAELTEASAGPIDEAALPLGRYDRGVLRALHREQYARVFSSDRAVADAQRWLQPRFSMRSTDTIQDVRRNLTYPSRLETWKHRLRSVAKAMR